MAHHQIYKYTSLDWSLVVVDMRVQILGSAWYNIPRADLSIALVYSNLLVVVLTLSLPLGAQLEESGRRRCI